MKLHSFISPRCWMNCFVYFTCVWSQSSGWQYIIFVQLSHTFSNIVFLVGNYSGRVLDLVGRIDDNHTYMSCINGLLLTFLKASPSSFSSELSPHLASIGKGLIFHIFSHSLDICFQCRFSVLWGCTLLPSTLAWVWL